MSLTRNQEVPHSTAELMNSDATRVLEESGSDPVSIAALAQRTGMHLDTVQAVCARLSVFGVMERLPGDLVATDYHRLRRLLPLARLHS